MSYSRHPSRIRRTRSGRVVRQAMGNSLEQVIKDLLAPGTGGFPAAWEAACPPSSTTLSLAAKATDLEATWNPTGFYSSADMRSILGAMMDAVNAQHNAVMTAQASYDIQPLREAATTYNEIGKRAIDYTEAWRAADASGAAAIDAPGLKRWVVDSLRALNKGMRAVEIAACDKPWWLTALAGYQAAFDKLIAVAKRIIGVIVKLGETLIKVAERTLDIVALLPYAAAAAGAYLVYTRIKRRG